MFHFKFEPESMVRICSCANIPLIYFNLRIPTINSDSNLMDGHIYMNVLFKCHVYPILLLLQKKNKVMPKKTKFLTENCQHFQTPPQPPSTKMNNRSIV